MAGEEVEEERPEPGPLELPRDPLIPRAQAAAPATVGEEDDAVPVGGDGDLALEAATRAGEQHFAPLYGLGTARASSAFHEGENRRGGDGYGRKSDARRRIPSRIAA